jgi:hypothetical protein
MQNSDADVCNDIMLLRLRLKVRWKGCRSGRGEESYAKSKETDS